MSRSIKKGRSQRVVF